MSAPPDSRIDQAPDSAEWVQTGPLGVNVGESATRREAARAGVAQPPTR